VAGFARHPFRLAGEQQGPAIKPHWNLLLAAFAGLLRRI
jgi:hypothetical protein